MPGANIAQIGLAPLRQRPGDARRRDRRRATWSSPSATCAATASQQAIDRALDHVAHCEAIVVDCDIDVIDRGQLPGAPGARPGGMAVAQISSAAVRLLAADPRVRLIDLTEWDPPLDPTDLSALTAARWVAECLAGFELR